LAAAADGSIYAGTDKTGRVYHVDAKGKGFVVYQAAQAEVRTLLLTDEALYVGTSGTKKPGSSGGTASTPSSAKLLAKEEAVPVSTKSKGKSKVSTSEKKSSESKEEKKGGSASAPSAPSAGGNSVYRIAHDGGAPELFRDKALVLGLAKQGKRLLAGTGMNAQLFEVDESSKERCEVARLDHGQITSLLHRKDGSLLVAAGDPGQLYVLEDRYKSKGTVTSDVLDAKLV